MSSLILIEDDDDIARAIGALLSRRGFNVSRAPDGREGLRLLHKTRPDLVLLDIGLPGMDGWGVLERIRDFSDVPVLLLTAAGREEDKVRGLRSGADDYLTKPFGNAELIARVEALLRRAGTPAFLDEAFGDHRIRVDPAARTLTVDGERIELSPIEFRLLSVLVRHSGQVLTTHQLLNLVWDDASGFGQERVKFAVLRLRKRLDWPGPESPIQAVRGVGYRYTPTG